MPVTMPRPVSVGACNSVAPPRACPSRNVPCTRQRLITSQAARPRPDSRRAASVASEQASTSAPDADTQRRLSSLGSVVTDAAVPEGHKGLHGFLYGEGGAEAHDSTGYSFRDVRMTALSPPWPCSSC